MKKILVVGSNGLVGTHFSELFQNKYDIRCISSSSNVDINEYKNIDEIEALVFLAQSKEYTSREFTENLFDINVSLVRTYLHTLIGKCKKIILFSTGSVYQESNDVITENFPVIEHNPNPYVASKLMSELVAKSFAHYYKNITIVRPFCIYGKGQKSTMLFSRLINNFRNKTPIEIGQEGGILFNPIHAEDVAYFIDFLVTRDSNGVEYFNIAGSELITLKDLIEKIQTILQLTPEILVREWPFKKSVAASINHIFKPKINIDTGLQRIIHSI